MVGEARSVLRTLAREPRRATRRVLHTGVIARGARRETTSTEQRAKDAGLDMSMQIEPWDKSAKATHDKRVFADLVGLTLYRMPPARDRARPGGPRQDLHERRPVCRDASAQWHNAPSAEFDGQRLGDYFENYLDGECALWDLSREDLRAWRPESSKGRKG